MKSIYHRFRFFRFNKISPPPPPTPPIEDNPPVIIETPPKIKRRGIDDLPTKKLRKEVLDILNYELDLDIRMIEMKEDKIIYDRFNTPQNQTEDMSIVKSYIRSDNLCSGNVNDEFIKTEIWKAHNIKALIYNHKVIGYVFYRLGRSGIYIDLICARSGLKKPIGSILLEYMKIEAFDNNMSSIHLESVNKKNTLEWYGKKGFVRKNNNIYGNNIDGNINMVLKL